MVEYVQPSAVAALGAAFDWRQPARLSQVLLLTQSRERPQRFGLFTDAKQLRWALCAGH